MENKILTVVTETEILGKKIELYRSIENPLFLAKDVAEWIDACKKYSVSDTAISCNLTGRNSFAGRDFETKMPLHWMYYDEYKNVSEEEIESKINSTPLKYSSIICMNDLSIFESATSALKHCNLHNVSSITDCCKGKIKYAGMVKDQRASWMYYKDYIYKYGEVS